MPHEHPTPWVTPRKNPGAIREARCRVLQLLQAPKDEELPSELPEKAALQVNKRTAESYMGTQGVEAVSWASCPGLNRADSTEPDQCRETLGRCPGSHHDDIQVENRIPSPTHTLACSKGGVQTRTPSVALDNFPALGTP